MDRFNAENEWGITVEMDISSSFVEQFSAALAANSGPALVLFSTAFRFQFADYLKDVSDIFEKTGMDKADFVQSYLDYCSEGDAMYLVPFQIVGFYMMWNKDLLSKQVSIPIPAQDTGKSGRSMPKLSRTRTRTSMVRVYRITMLTRLLTSSSVSAAWL